MVRALLALCMLWSVGALGQGLEQKGGKLLYCGKPIRLIAYGDYGMVSESSFDYAKYFDKLASYGVNMSRVWVVYHWTHDLLPWAGKWKSWDLQNYDEAFFLRLHDFVEYAQKRGIIVQVTFFDSCGIETESPIRWNNSPYNKNNNKQSYCASNKDVDDLDGSPPVWEEVNKPLIKKVVDTLDGLDNVIYEVMNEPHDDFGKDDFLGAVINELYKHLNAPGHTGSTIISLNGGSQSLKSSAKVNLLSVHLAGGGPTSAAGNYGNTSKPIIVSNDGDQSQATKGYSEAERVKRTKALCQEAFSDGSALGHTHFEFLDKDIMGSSWLTTDYDPLYDNMDAKILAVLKEFVETPAAPNCGPPVDIGPIDPKPTPGCPIGKQIAIDNGQKGYKETGSCWATWPSLGQSMGKDYRYLSKYVGDKTAHGTATWTPNLPVKGMYRVQAVYRSTGNRTDDADYFVHPAVGPVKQYVEDQSGGKTGEASEGPLYAELGTHYFEPGKGYVVLDGTDDKKSDEADAMIWTLKECLKDGPCTPDCAGKGAGADNGCGKPCPGGPCVPSCDGKPGGAGDGCGGTCPGACTPSCEGQSAGAPDGCGGACEGPIIPVDPCPSPGPGPTTTVAYAQATSGKGWEDMGLAEDKDDGKLAHTPNLDAGEAITGTSFGTCDPTGPDQIVSVKVAVKSRVQYASGKYAVKLKLGSGGQKIVFAHEKLGWDELDVTAQKPSWTWDAVKSLKATLALESHPGGYKDSDVWVDAFRVTVVYQSCTPNVAKGCAGGNVAWMDGCGQPGEVLAACDDGDACTDDGCGAGAEGAACTHTTKPGCVKPPSCTPNAGKECFSTALLTVDSCGHATGIADTCNDGDPCTVDGCDPATAACTHAPSDAPGCKVCAPHDHTICVAASVVWVDSCGNVGEVYESCDDGATCTLDSCKDGTCDHQPSTSPGCADCSATAAVVCSGNALVEVSMCGNLGKTVEDCDDGDACTLDACDTLGKVCLHTPLGAPGCVPCAPKAKATCLGDAVVWLDSCGNAAELAQGCNDGDPCTVDSCSDGACSHAASQAVECAGCPPMQKKACSGGLVVWMDGCNNVGSVVASCNDGDACTIDLCAGGECSHVASTSAQCSECTPDAKTGCVGGLVVSIDSCGNLGALVDTCDDDSACTIDLCDAALGTCHHVPSDAPGCVPCEPTNETMCFANTLVSVDTCGNVGGLVKTCDDQDGCTLDVCEQAACAHYPSPSIDCKACVPTDTLACEGGNLVGVDSCGALGALVAACADDDPCTTDGCDDDTAQCVHVPVAGCGGCAPKVQTVCYGGDLVWVDGCGHVDGVAQACADGDPCTDDACEAEYAACTHVPSSAAECQGCVPGVKTACHGLDVVWVDSCGVEGGVAVACDDGDPCTLDTCDVPTALCVHLPMGDADCVPEEPCLAEPTKHCEGKDVVWLDPCGQPAGIAAVCLDDDPSTDDGCDEETLACVFEKKSTADCGGAPAPDSACGKGATLVCDGADLVFVDACGNPAGIALACEDGDPCTVDGCDEATKACVHVATSAANCGDVPPPPDAEPEPGADAGGVPPDSDASAVAEPVEGPGGNPAGPTPSKDDGCRAGGAGSSGGFLALLIVFTLALLRRRHEGSPR